MLESVEHWKRTLETAGGSETCATAYGNVTIPNLPPEAVQLNTTGQSGEATLKAAAEFFDTCRRYFEKTSVWEDATKSLLDFGCGWGRITRFFLFDIKPPNLFGIDIEPGMIEHCQQTFHGQGNFRTCEAFPPTAFEPESFTYIVAFSVFSHLSESACRRWLEHFYTLLKPGGMIIVSTRGKAFLRYCRGLASASPKDSYSQSLAAMFDDFDEAESRFDAGEFLFRTSQGLSGGGAMNEGFYGETFIPLQYAETHYSDLFDVVEIAPDDGVNRSVPYLVFTKLTTVERRAELKRLREMDADLGARTGDLAEAAIANRVLEAKLRSAELRLEFARKQLGRMSGALLQSIAENILALQSWSASGSWKAARLLPRIISQMLGRKSADWTPAREAEALANEVMRLKTIHGDAKEGHIPAEKLILLHQKSKNVLASLEASLSLQITGPLRSIERLRKKFGRPFRKKKQGGSAELQEFPLDNPCISPGAARATPVTWSDLKNSAEPSLAIHYSSEGNYFFREISILLATGFRRLGVPVELRTELGGWSESARINFVVAPHEYFLLGRGPEELDTVSRERLILINTEQHQTSWFARALATFSHARHIFDIDAGNIQTIKRLGFSASHLPLGYLADFPLYDSIAPLPEAPETQALSAETRQWLDLELPLASRPIDVSFVGEANLRRAQFFAEAASCLQKYESHLRLIPQTGPRLAGSADRDLNTKLTAGISRRSKIVLNIHRDKDPYFEWHRIVLMGIWQKALVISEKVPETPPFVAGADFVHAPLDEIPALIDYYLRDPHGIHEAEEIRLSGFRRLEEFCPLTDAITKSMQPIFHDAALL